MTRAVRSDPEKATARMHYELGKVQLLAGRYDEAVSSLTRAIEANPSYGLAYANRGVTYRNKGDYSLAAKDFRKALTLLHKPSRLSLIRKYLAETERAANVRSQPRSGRAVPESRRAPDSRRLRPTPPW